MSDYIEVKVDDLPEVEVLDEFTIMVGEWGFDRREGIPTMADVAAFAAAVLWFEQHPEVVPDGG